MPARPSLAATAAGGGGRVRRASGTPSPSTTPASETETQERHRAGESKFFACTDANPLATCDSWCDAATHDQAVLVSGSSASAGPEPRAVARADRPV